MQQTAEDALAAANSTGNVQCYEANRSWTAAFQKAEKAERCPVNLHIRLYTVDGMQLPTREAVAAAFASIAASCGQNADVEHIGLLMDVEEPHQHTSYSAELTGSSIRNTTAADHAGASEGQYDHP